MDEMLDNGYPLTTELNVLQDLIKPPNFLRSLTNQVTGKTNVSEILPTGQLSNVPWRRAGVKYTNNEAYFDVIEEIDAIIDRQGATVSAEIQGYVSKRYYHYIFLRHYSLRLCYRLIAVVVSRECQILQ